MKQHKPCHSGGHAEVMAGTATAHSLASFAAFDRKHAEDCCLLCFEIRTDIRCLEIRDDIRWTNLSVQRLRPGMARMQINQATAAECTVPSPLKCLPLAGPHQQVSATSRQSRAAYH